MERKNDLDNSHLQEEKEAQEHTEKEPTESAKNSALKLQFISGQPILARYRCVVCNKSSDKPLQEGWGKCEFCRRWACKDHIRVNSRNVNVCSVCDVEVRWSAAKPTIRVKGTDASEVQTVTLAILEKATMKSSRKQQSPWISGSFYLIGFLIVIAAFSVVGHLLPLYVLPTVLIGGILALSVIGAFQLRQDDRLSQRNFLELMGLTFKYLPWLRRREKKTSKNIASTSPNTSVPDDISN